MDTLRNIRCFLLAARLGSFAATARSLGVAPSVVSKRIAQLEHEFGVVLFHRSTRALRLSDEAARLLARFEELIAEFDSLRDLESRKALSGHLRIEAPGTVTTMILAPILCEFLKLHPGITMDLKLVDRIDNPGSIACDLVFGIRPSTSEQIIDLPLIPYPCGVYAGSSYVERHGEPTHPHDLTRHHCLVSMLFGSVWHFYGPAGDTAVTVQPRMAVNDAAVLSLAVRHGLGVAIVPDYLVADDLAAGRIVPLLRGFALPPLWLKVLVPSQRAMRPAVRALLDFLRLRMVEGPAEAGWRSAPAGLSAPE